MREIDFLSEDERYPSDELTVAQEDLLLSGEFD